MRVQGWDPVLIICQIISVQTIHYLTLALLLPAMLASFTSPSLLHYSGGPTTVGHVMDWREMAARSTASTSFKIPFGGAWAGGKQVGTVPEDADVGELVDDDLWDYGVDETRSWTIGVAWLVACAVDIVPLYYLVRRPTHILDFSLTLNFNHLILTTYYAKSFPTSIYYWVVQSLGALLMIVVAEQLCVKREMSSELDVGWDADRETGEVIELNER